jgi:hypothetical protein
MQTQIPDYLVIRVHSFVDLITNSSTEIYIRASDKTVTSIKQMVNNILELGQSKLTCDDLFVVELSKLDNEEDEYFGCGKVILIVKSKDPKSKVGAATASILACLTSLFSISAEYNG